jgi:exosortase/archaeosortase family protein
MNLKFLKAILTFKQGFLMKYKPGVFITSAFSAYLLPAIIPGTGIDYPIVFTVGIILFAWFVFKWNNLKLLDTKPTKKQLLVLMIVGFTGAFLINIVRLAVIFLTFEYLGVEAGRVMHIYAGYTLFIAWVLAFWSIAFKRIYSVPSKSISSMTKQAEGSSANVAHV